MKLPTGGGLNQQISGRIRLDISGFKADAARLAKEAKASAESINKAYSTTGQQAAIGIKALSPVLVKQRQEMEKNARSALALEKQKQVAAAATARLYQQQQDALRRQIAKWDQDAIRAEKQKQAASAATAREQERLARKVQAATVQAGRDALRVEKQKQDAARETARLMAKPYNDFRIAVGEARTTLLAFTAAASGLIFVGLKAADSLDLLTIRYRELARGQEEGTRLMRQVERVAREMNLPIRATQEQFLGLIPAVREANGSLEEYANVAIRLATLNNDSRGGVEGAIYAIREALSSGGTDLVSLSERFNIPRKALRQAIEDTGDLAKALDIILERYGATDTAAKANARTLGNLSRLIQDTVSRALERTFAGALETAKNLLDGFNTLLESTPQWLIDVGAGATIAVGAFTALMLAVDLVSGAYIRGLAAMRAYAAFMKARLIPALLASKVAQVGVGLGAIGVGAVLGKELVNAVGRGTGDERLANYELDQAVTTIKQTVFLIASALISASTWVAKSIADVVNSFNGLNSVVQELGLRFRILITDFAISIQRFLQSIGAGSDDEIERLYDVRNTATNELNDIVSQRTNATNAQNDAIDTAANNIRLALYNALFPVEVVAGETADAVTNLEQALQKARDRFWAFLSDQGDLFAASADSAIQFKQELSELFAEGDIEGLESHIVGLERERDAIANILPELEKQAEYSNDAADKLAEYNTRLSEIAQSLPDFIDALAEITKRETVEAYREFKDALTKARTEYSAEVRKAQDEFKQDNVKFAKDEAKKRETLRRKEADADDTYRKAIIKAETDFRKRMIDIQRNFIKAVALAASSLDAAGVVAAIQARVEDKREANERVAEQRESARERIHEQRLEAAQEMEDLRVELKERRDEILADRAARIAAAQVERAESLQTAGAAYLRELLEIRTYYTTRYADLQRYLAEESALMIKQRQALLSEFAKKVILPTLTDIFGTTVPSAISGVMNIGNVIFQITGVTDPVAVAQAVNTHLVILSRGGSAGLGGGRRGGSAGLGGSGRGGSAGLG